MYFETEKVLEDQIIMSVDFSNDDKDFWGVNNAVNELLLKQSYVNRKYIKQDDIETIDIILKNINSKDIETLNYAIDKMSTKFKNIEDIMQFIKHQNEYILIYMDNEELGRFIVNNIETYKIPIEVLNQIEEYIDFKGIAQKYINDYQVGAIELYNGLMLLKNRDDDLILKLKERGLDSRTIYEKIENNRIKNNQIEEESEME